MKGTGKRNHQGPVPPTAGGGEAVKREPPEHGREPALNPVTGGEGRGRYESNQKLLIGLAAAILVVLIAASSFALGYAIGNQNAGISTLVGERPVGPLPQGGPTDGQAGPWGEKGLRAPEGAEEGELPDVWKLKERMQRHLKDENTELIEGEVASIDGSAVSVQGLSGAVTVIITEETRFLGAGAGEAGGGQDIASRLAPGTKVNMLIRKADDGSLEVLAVHEGP